MRFGLGIRNTTLLRTRLHLLLKQRLMHRLRRSRLRLGQPQLLQRRRAGRNGHAQRISCSSSFAVAEEGGEVEKKGCKRLWPNSPSLCSCFFASRCHYSSLSLRGCDAMRWCGGCRWCQPWCGPFPFPFSLFPLRVGFSYVLKYVRSVLRFSLVLFYVFHQTNGAQGSWRRGC
jgi:hypothetical protein